MSKCNKSPRNDQQSIKYRWNQAGGPSFSDNIFAEEYASTLSDDKQHQRESAPKFPEVSSLAKLISEIGQIWDSTSSPLSFFHPKEIKKHDDKVGEDTFLKNFCMEGNRVTSMSSDANYFCVDMRALAQDSPMMQPKLNISEVIHKMSVFESYRGSQNYTHSSFQKYLLGGANISNKYRMERTQRRLGIVDISYQMESRYGWMSKKTPAGVKHPIKLTKPENVKTSDCSIPSDIIRAAGDCISVDTIVPDLDNTNSDSSPDFIVTNSLPPSDEAKLETNTRNATCLCSDYFLRAIEDVKEDAVVTRNSCSSICADYHISPLVTCDGTSVRCQYKIDGNELLENKRKQPENSITNDESTMEAFSLVREKPCYFLAKQEHAFAGALAGIFVSLCLHPVDTVKTVIQSCRADQSSIFYIGKSIVSDRGFPGLYRGIATNITSSAPISAIYTFTYESIKATLLPLFSKVSYSLVHCVAGGCASVATSFIFTPSERIKQQVQVGSHYHNCWDALVGIIRKGGLPSLYAGWGAVLCRNVPHSVIKFYTYERLKQVKLLSSQSGTQPNTLQTLACGGLAGSTAALFTTPFDVVKTRLQTQVYNIPGSINQYDSVFHALCKISKHEGLKGLYRGLTPRLVMYMSQGALFFASYEFFKRLFLLEALQIQ
ncbi:putative Mitochondrial carrier protein [Quillaja saponaria]|uniref:Mitochondrial carrier protein n=1 Tax=Quillaja saponaria TaxID=32244 RepID=A0AAD7P7F7_QUISA|nr:putative Mitochondrial carrier protein [Quillaja saponaria]